jgi:multicomponent Na+:H+ antiporter subunit A
MDISTAVLSVFALAVIAPWVYRLGGRKTGAILSLLPFSLAVYFLTFVRGVASGEVFLVAYSWVPSLGLRLSFYLDGWSLLFALLISVVGGLVLIYAGSYLEGHPELGRFYAYITLFMASMLGLVLADNLILLFVFWELTSFSSYLLIGFDHERDSARAGALQALLVTGSGGLALLAGFVLLGQVTGSFEYSASLAQGDVVRTHSLYTPIIFLILAGAFTKSAQFPFHFWLPNAMEAPTPVSAYLHSATMVKAGVYLLGRLSPILGDTPIWSDAVTCVGAITMLLGAWMALHQSDLKRLLAYSTVSALGVLTFLLGINTPHAITGMVVFLFGHALYKGALFLIAGIIDHETGTRDVNRLSGLRRAMPLTAAAGFLAAVSMAGLPPFFGFFGKETVYAALLGEDTAGLLVAAAVLTNMFFFAVAGVAVAKPFFGRKIAAPKKPHEAPPALWSGPMVLAGAGLVLGLLPRLVDHSLLLPAAQAISRQPVSLELALWHGLTPALLLSIATFAGGLAIYLWREKLSRWSSLFDGIQRWGPERWYEVLLDGLNATARLQTRVLQSGYLRYYLLIIIMTTVATVALALSRLDTLDFAVRWSDWRFYEVGLAVLVLLATLTAVLSSSRLGAVAALGVVGYGIALLFILFGAPDLAMTQFLIETLMVILFVFVLYYLPRFANLSPPRARIRDAFVALVSGGLVTLLVLAVSSVQLHPKISGYFAENSLTLAHGRNIVNVILVDFRALDTLGEITVLVIAGVGVLALLKLRPAKENKS